MFYQTSNKLAMEDIRSLAAGSVVAGYTAVGSAFAFPINCIVIQNLTDATVMFSISGGAASDKLPLAANGMIVLDLSANGGYFPKGTVVSVKRVGTPTTGNIYVSTIYRVW